MAMKAKEITKKLIKARLSGNETLQSALEEVFTHFRDNFFELKEARNVKTDAGLVGIFRDQKSKWDAVNRQTGGYLGDYFFFIETIMNKNIADFARQAI